MKGDFPMPDKDQKPAPRSIPAELVLLGGEPLEGSGFEDEKPEPDSEWRDPR
jgi:hypothetical protein